MVSCTKIMEKQWYACVWPREGMKMSALCCLKEHFFPLVSAVFLKLILVVGWITLIKYLQLYPNSVLSISICPRLLTCTVNPSHSRWYVYLSEYSVVSCFKFQAFPHSFESYAEKNAFLTAFLLDHVLLQTPQTKPNLLYMQNISHLQCFGRKSVPLLPPTLMFDLIKAPDTGVCGQGEIRVSV